MPKQQKSGSSSNCILISSPLQGFTDFRFRKTFNKYFGGIDLFYAPYIRLNGKGHIKSANKLDILPENNSGIYLVPQVMTNDGDEFLQVADYVQKLGYNELNWNLGCPYPMVVKRGLGSGLIKDELTIDTILKKVYDTSSIQVSIKIRLGYEDKSELLRLLPILDKYPLKGIGIHSRLGRHMYKSDVDLGGFQQCAELSRHKLYYNGDIKSVRVFQELEKRFQGVNHWMIGRGLIADPFLPGMIKNRISHYPENKMELFSKFHDSLFEEYGSVLSGANHLIQKMYQFWEYFIRLFPADPKGLKKIKKARNIAGYEIAVRNILMRNEDTGID